MQVRYSIILPFLLLPQMGNAQTDILPDLYGEELIEGLAERYYPEELLSLSQAKDTLYSVIDIGTDDSVRCIYTDRAIFVPPGQDPSQSVFMNGSGINLEHLWPQSKGAGDGTPGQSDMHHLAPSRVDVNSKRANNPFAESPDQETEKWYYLEYERMSIPAASIDVYSEADNFIFEPREDRKGDIARSLFYFYTIYHDDADKAFFEAQMTTLCSWHLADPVDERELLRADRIELYQGNTNPFLLDCTLPSRAFCGSEFNCTTSAEALIGRDLNINVAVYDCQVNIDCNVKDTGILHCRLYSVNGIERYVVRQQAFNGTNRVTFSACEVPAGLYILTVEVESNGKRHEARPTKLILH